MIERWDKANKLSIPQLDIDEIEEQGHFNHPLTGCPLSEMRQVHPEYVQSSYEKIR